MIGAGAIWFSSARQDEYSCTVKKFFQTFHRWAGLVLVAQILLWFASGLFMSVVDQRLVMGETASLQRFPIPLDARSYASPGGVVAQLPDATHVELRVFLDRTVYEVTGVDAKALFDADTGQKISPLPEKMIRRIAASDFVGDGAVEAIRILHDAPDEYRESLPVWQVQFSDRDKTRLYISPDTGEILARRNRISRIYGFFWMLHIMDYDEGTNTNNPLLVFFTASALVFALSGLALAAIRVRSGRYARDIGQVFERFAGERDVGEPDVGENS